MLLYHGYRGSIMIAIWHDIIICMKVHNNNINNLMIIYDVRLKDYIRFADRGG